MEVHGLVVNKNSGLFPSRDVSAYKLSKLTFSANICLRPSNFCWANISGYSFDRSTPLFKYVLRQKQSDTKLSPAQELPFSILPHLSEQSLR